MLRNRFGDLRGEILPRFARRNDGNSFVPLPTNHQSASHDDIETSIVRLEKARRIISCLLLLSFRSREISLFQDLVNAIRSNETFAEIEISLVETRREQKASVSSGIKLIASYCRLRASWKLNTPRTPLFNRSR